MFRRNNHIVATMGATGSGEGNGMIGDSSSRSNSNNNNTVSGSSSSSTASIGSSHLPLSTTPSGGVRDMSITTGSNSTTHGIFPTTATTTAAAAAAKSVTDDCCGVSIGNGNNNNNNNHHYNHRSSLKKYTIRNKWRSWWRSSSTITPTTTTTTTTVMAMCTPNRMIMGLLVCIILFQYSTIRSKDDIIMTLQQRTHQSIGDSGGGGGNDSTSIRSSSSSSKSKSMNIVNRDLFNVGSGVGIFPLREPITTTSTLIKEQQPWIPYSSVILSKVSYPIFVPSLPKSGTTSIWKFFKCGQQESCHNWVQIRSGMKASLLGKCMEDNIIHANPPQPPFSNCGPYDVYTDSGYLTYDHDAGEHCFYPSIDGLDAIYDSYPNITFVNVVRNTEAWYNSLKGWSQSSLFVRLRLCNATGFPNGQSTKQDFMQMYDNFNRMIRQFVKDRPSITYIEVQLESNDTGRLLEEATGIDSTCWKVCKPQERHCEGDHPTNHVGPKQRRQKSNPKNQHQKHIKSVNEATTNDDKGDDDDKGGNDDNDEGV